MMVGTRGSSYSDGFTMKLVVSRNMDSNVHSKEEVWRYEHRLTSLEDAVYALDVIVAVPSCWQTSPT